MSDERRAVRAKAQAARAAALELQTGSDEERATAVGLMADAIWAARDTIVAANADDLAQARADGVAGPLVARLKLDETKLQAVLDGARQVAALPDPVGVTLRSMRLDDGLDLYQVTVPLGVVGVVFESRPDALVQIAALAVRSGNAALLKGGREAERTNQALAAAIRTGLQGSAVPADAVQLLLGRSEVAALLDLDDLVDLVIPRGSSDFVRHVMDNTRIPVMGHAEGVCHVYVDEGADLDMAVAVSVDAKTDYPAACNAVETVLVHADVATAFVPMLRAAFEARDVEVVEGPDGFGVEFGDLRCGLGVVPDLESAIAHINRYGSGHTDAIVTSDRARARRFIAGVDAASVMWNASPRFADGFRYGLGAEVGISTSKIHARGPVGLDGLTTTKWVLLGKGQTAASYQGPSARPFVHVPSRASLDEALP